MSDIEIKIANVKDLINTVKVAVMATVNKDGSPHNSPFVFMINDDLTRLYWGSHKDSKHSQNILRTGELYVVLFDAFSWREALYIQASSGRIAVDDELDEALAVHNKVRMRNGKKPIIRDYYTKGQQDMWVAETVTFWTNGREDDEQGHLLKDIKIELSREQLKQEGGDYE